MLSRPWPTGRGRCRAAAAPAARRRSSSRPRSARPAPPRALDRVCAGALAPLAGAEIPIDQLRRAACETSHAVSATPPRSVSPVEQARGRSDLVGSAGEPLQEAARLLAVGAACRAGRRRAARPCPRPARGRSASPGGRCARPCGSAFSSTTSSGSPGGQLVDVGGRGPRTGCRAAPGSPALRRARSEHQPGHCRRATAELREEEPISRAADSAESEPCTRLNVTSVAKSPRIEPGAASSGLVAPITCRAACDRALAFQHHRDQRPARDELDQLAEERLLAVLAVVRSASSRRRASA